MFPFILSYFYLTLLYFAVFGLPLFDYIPFFFILLLVYFILTYLLRILPPCNIHNPFHSIPPHPHPFKYSSPLTDQRRGKRKTQINIPTIPNRSDNLHKSCFSSSVIMSCSGPPHSSLADEVREHFPESKHNPVLYFMSPFLTAAGSRHMRVQVFPARTHLEGSIRGQTSRFTAAAK